MARAASGAGANVNSVGRVRRDTAHARRGRTGTAPRSRLLKAGATFPGHALERRIGLMIAAGAGSLEAVRQLAFTAPARTRRSRDEVRPRSCGPPRRSQRRRRGPARDRRQPKAVSKTGFNALASPSQKTMRRRRRLFSPPGSTPVLAAVRERVLMMARPLATLRLRVCCSTPGLTSRQQIAPATRPSTLPRRMATCLIKQLLDKGADPNVRTARATMMARAAAEAVDVR